jgi:predicted chitinase
MVGYEQKRQVPVSRLGGSTFVMDDGDINGQNELVRIRTRTGHQILMHNSQDLIYIGNSKGSAWIELTSNGKIDIFSQDSISIHSEQDFNFRADRDINFEAGRNIHMNAFDGFELNCKSRFYLVCDTSGKMVFGNNLNVATGDSVKISAGGNINTEAGGTSSHASAGAFSIGTADNLICGASGTLSLGASGNIIAVGAEIQLNGPAAPDPNTPDPAEIPEKLDIFSLPNREISYGWGPDKFYTTGTITTIMQRVPTHEPWPHHENINPEKFTPASTNVVITPRADSSTGPTAPPPADGSGVSPPINDAPVATPLKGKSADNEKYLQATLIANGVTDPIKLAAWMAQCKVESDNFRALREYASGAEYEGRTDLGNRTAGDGVRYKGRGFIQLTGRDVYRKMTKYFNSGTDFEQQPDLVEGIEWASKSVLYFFNVYKPKGFKNKTMTQPYQDTTAFWDDPLSVTALVNGGKNGYEKRKQYYAEYKAKFEKDGVTPSGIVSSGSGGIVTDSNGKPIKSGS